MIADLKPHKLAREVPEMLRDEYVGMVADIKAHGLRLPIVLFDGQILDGRHRARACVELGIEPKVETFNGTEAEAWSFVQSINAHRRHLTLEAKQKIIAAELKRDPKQSDRQAAKKANASPTTAGKVRAKLEAAGELSTVDSSVGADGKVRPRKPKATTTTAAEQPTAAQTPAAAESLTPREREWNAAQAEAATLSETAKAKFDRIVKKAKNALQQEFQVECRKHKAELWATVEARVAKARQHHEEQAEKAREAEAQCRERLRTYDTWCTEAEHKFLLGCVHPDRQPEDQRAKYDKAFQIVKRFEAHLDPSKRALKKNEWPNWANAPERKRAQRART